MVVDENYNDEGRPNIEPAYGLSHVPFGKEIQELLQLEGQQYRLAAKALSYNLLGEYYKLPLNYGGIHDDTRTNLIFSQPSGSGKLSEMQTQSTCAGALELGVVRPVSYHPEQFIGKLVMPPESNHLEEPMEIEGHFRMHFIQIEEGYSLLSGKEQMAETTWKNLSIALDPIGRNQIQKKLVGMQSALSYYPECSVVMAIQPRPLPSDVFLQGLTRRFFIIHIRVERKEEEIAFEKRLRRQNKASEAAIKVFRDFAAKHKGESFSAPLLPETLFPSIKERQCEILSYLRARSEKSARFAEIIKFQIQNTIIKLAAILALYRGHREIQQQDIDDAFVDAFEFLDSSSRYVESCAMGSLDYGDDWNGATGPYQEALRILSVSECYSRDVALELGMTVVAFRNQVKEIFGISTDRQARNKIAIMRANSWIRCYSGRGKSAVWLAFKPRTVPTETWDPARSKYVELTKGAEKGENVPLTPTGQCIERDSKQHTADKVSRGRISTISSFSQKPEVNNVC